MAFVLQCTTVSGLVRTGIPFDPVGLYLAAYDPEFHDGEGQTTFTMEIDRALCFDNVDQVTTFIYQIPRARLLRADGKPNRPLRAFGWLVVPLEDAS